MFDLGSQKKRSRSYQQEIGHTPKRETSTCIDDHAPRWTSFDDATKWCPMVPLQLKKIQDQASESPEKLAFAGALRTSVDRLMSQKPGTQTGPYKKDSEWMWIHPSHMVNS